MTTLLTYREEIEHRAHVLAEHHLQIKTFVQRHGAHAADLLRAATQGEHGGTVPSHADHDPSALAEATHIVSRIGHEAVTALIDVVQWYYEASLVDVRV